MLGFFGYYMGKGLFSWYLYSQFFKFNVVQQTEKNLDYDIKLLFTCIPEQKKY